MRRIVLCAALAGSLLLAGASPALAAPRVGMASGAEVSAWLGDLMSRIFSRFFGASEPVPSNDPFAKTGCDMDPLGRPVCTATAPDPGTTGRGKIPDPFAKNGCEMDPWGRPICATVSEEARGRRVGDTLPPPGRPR